MRRGARAARPHDQRVVELVPVSHGPRGLPAQAVPRVLPDATSCTHRIVELFGVSQCSRCDRYFDEVELDDGSWALQVLLPKYPPRGEPDASD